MSDQVVTLHFADDEDLARYCRLKGDAAGQTALSFGVKHAREIVLPALLAGAYGNTEDRIDANVKGVLIAIRKGHGAFTRDEWFMYRLGFNAVVIPARQEALAAVEVGKALVLGAIVAAQPAHALAPPAHRRLRPEDFGALPARSRL